MAKEEYTKQALADSLRQLIRKKPYSSITVTDITRNCGLSRHTFYYHFKDKKDLVMWIYLDTRARTIKATNTETVSDNIHRLLSLMYENALLYSQIRYDIDQNSFKEIFFEENYRCFCKLFRSYLGDRKLEPAILDYLARYFTWAGTEIAFDLMEGKISLSIDDVINISGIIWEKGLYGTLDAYAFALPASKGLQQNT